MQQPSWTQRYRQKHFPSHTHPYVVYASHIQSILRSDYTLLDAGCGRSGETLQQFAGCVRCAVGIDLEVPDQQLALQTAYTIADVHRVPVKDESVDVVIARSVIEHLRDPTVVWQEFARILKPGGRVVLLTPNLWDYASLISRLIPSRWHPFLVRVAEGRDESDTFPTYYRCNTRSAFLRCAMLSGFRMESFRYLGQYPNYLQFNAALFVIGSVYARLIDRVQWLNWLKPWILATFHKSTLVNATSVKGNPPASTDTRLACAHRSDS